MEHRRPTGTREGPGSGSLLRRQPRRMVDFKRAEQSECDRPGFARRQRTEPEQSNGCEPAAIGTEFAGCRGTGLEQTSLPDLSGDPDTGAITAAVSAVCHHQLLLVAPGQDLVRLAAVEGHKAP